MKSEKNHVNPCGIYPAHIKELQGMINHIDEE